MNDNQQRMALMRQRLTDALSPSKLDIIDDSHQHVGHAGAKDGRGHFSVQIAANAFAGLSLAAQHRLIYKALGELMQSDIHALSIKIVS